MFEFVKKIFGRNKNTTTKGLVLVANNKSIANKPSVGNTTDQASGGDFATSFLVGRASNNALLGGLVGGSVIGGVLGDVSNDGAVGVATTTSNKASSYSSDDSSSYSRSDSSSDSGSSSSD